MSQPDVERFRPYLRGWQLDDARRYFGRPDVPFAVSLRSEDERDGLRWREVTMTVDHGIEAPATVVSPTSGRMARGVVLAHGGSGDGRHFLFPEATELAAEGAMVILPATRSRPDDGIGVFVDDVRVAVLTERAALDVLVQFGAPADELSYLGHSAGAAQGAVLTVVEPRLARICIFSYGTGSLIRMARADHAGRGQELPAEWVAAAEWLDPGNFVSVGRDAVLLVQHGRADPIVPIAEARALFEVAAEPKRWAEYDWDHGLDADPAARRDRAAFVGPAGRSWSGASAK